MVEDGFWLIFLVHDQVLAPTMAKTSSGFHMGVEPVEVADAREPQAVEQAVIRAVMRGNPRIPTPPGGANFPKSPMLKHAKLKSRSSFDRLAKAWKLSKREGAYLIVPYRPRKDSGSEEDTERGEAMPTDVPLENVVHRLVSRILADEMNASASDTE